MDNLMPMTTTSTELQRQFKTVAKKAKQTKKPLVVLINNKPQGIYMDYETFINEYNKSVLPIKSKKADFGEFSGLWTDKEAAKFNRIIDSAFEQINPDDWR